MLDPHVNPDDSQLWRSVDGAATWNPVGMKKSMPSASGRTLARRLTLTLYAVGWFNNVFGVWKSVDNAGAGSTGIPLGISTRSIPSTARRKATGCSSGLEAGYVLSRLYRFPCSDGVDNDGDGIADTPAMLAALSIRHGRAATT
jgi:hypothetical protein